MIDWPLDNDGNPGEPTRFVLTPPTPAANREDASMNEVGSSSGPGIDCLQLHCCYRQRPQCLPCRHVIPQVWYQTAHHCAIDSTGGAAAGPEPVEISSSSSDSDDDIERPPTKKHRVAGPKGKRIRAVGALAKRENPFESSVRLYPNLRQSLQHERPAAMASGVLKRDGINSGGRTL